MPGSVATSFLRILACAKSTLTQAMPERRFDDFDPFAQEYRQIHDQNVAVSGADSAYFAAMKVNLLAQLGQQGPATWLDLGCGDGLTETFIEKRFPNIQVDGIDVSAESIAVAQQRSLSNTRFQTYNGSTIPFPDQHFDTVFVAGVFHHVEASLHAGLLREIARVLKPGGQLFLFEHNPLNPATRYLVRTCVFDKDARLLTSGYLRKAIMQAGLTLKPTRFILFFPRGRFFRWMHPAENWLTRIPLGAQYLLQATKPIS